MNSKLTADSVERAHRIFEAARAELAGSGVAPTPVAEFVPGRGFWVFRRSARFKEIARGWRLGVLIVGTDGRIFATGETTRAITPGYPGHTSHERERRRAYIKAAYESGFEQGTVVYFDSPEIPLAAGQELPSGSPLTVVGGEIRVLWNQGVTAGNSADLQQYVTEQVSLRAAQ